MSSRNYSHNNQQGKHKLWRPRDHNTTTNQNTDATENANPTNVANEPLVHQEIEQNTTIPANAPKNSQELHQQQQQQQQQQDKNIQSSQNKAPSNIPAQYLTSKPTQHRQNNNYNYNYDYNNSYNYDNSYHNSNYYHNQRNYKPPKDHHTTTHHHYTDHQQENAEAAPNALTHKVYPNHEERKKHPHPHHHQKAGKPTNTQPKQSKQPQTAKNKTDSKDKKEGENPQVSYGAFSTIIKKPPSQAEPTAAKLKAKQIMYNKPDGVEFSDLTEEMIEKLSTDSYECMICYETVKRHVAIWSCSCCFKIFHLWCIKQWCKNSQEVEWRCPACQFTYAKDQRPNKYTCFCGKSRDPQEDASGYILPHSCGDVCGKLRTKTPCPHPCTAPCHPGPCPPCFTMRTAYCWCGKHTISVRCSSSTVHYACEDECGQLLNCRLHTCTATCHEGTCNKCDKVYQQWCYCGKSTEERLCVPTVRERDGDITRSYSCSQICGKTLDCGNHTCQRFCHSGPCSGCPRLPERVSKCPCGKKQLANQTRTSCLDPIPTCGRPCGKTLGCKKHSCKQRCHDSECGDCEVEVEVACRCGSITRRLPCFVTYKPAEEVAQLKRGLPSYPLTCNTVCGAMKNCGRHKCKDLCCPNRKQETSESHVCDKICGKLLSCGTHHCPRPCHQGECRQCFEIVTTEIACRCGQTVLYPPQPCGTKPPECPHPCSIPRPCGHPSNHPCHMGDCPPCLVVVERECAGGHKKIRTPCHVGTPGCGKKCGKLLNCQLHACEEKCHAGRCPKSTRQGCSYLCSRPLQCGHPCREKCHPATPCDIANCPCMVKVYCKCKRLSGEVPCKSLRKQLLENNGDYWDTIPLYPPSSENEKFFVALECDEECKRLDRIKKLAEALDIKDPERPPVMMTPTYYSDELVSLAKKNPKFVETIEQRLKEFLDDVPKKLYPFESMNRDKRQIVHDLCEQYHMESYASDPEPHRSVTAVKTEMSRVPSPTLSECLRDPSKLIPRPEVQGEESKSAATLKKKATKTKPTVVWGAVPTPVNKLDGDTLEQSVRNMKKVGNAAIEQKNMWAVLEKL